MAGIIPDPTISSDGPVTEGDTFYLSGSFADAGGNLPTQWNVNWGDGTSGTFAGASDGFEFLDSSGSDYGGPLDATHVYTHAGTYTITASAVDSNGVTWAAAHTLAQEVDQATPTFSITGGDTFTPGTAYLVTNSWSDNGVNNPTSYTVSWGDGTAARAYPGNATSFSYNYAGGPNSPYTITATAITPEGSFSTSTSVDEAPPTVSITGGSAVEGSPVALEGNFSDPGGFPPMLWTVLWGDSAMPTTYSGTGKTTVLTHTYYSEPPGGGAWTVLASASAVDGTFYADETQVDVSNSTPTVSLTGATTINQGSAAILSNGFSDPNGETPYDWTIDWGDGTGSIFYDGNPGTFSHTYANTGSFSISTSARARDGTYAASTEITVVEPVPLFYIPDDPSVTGEK